MAWIAAGIVGSALIGAGSSAIMGNNSGGHSSGTLAARAFDYSDFAGSGVQDFQTIDQMYSLGMPINAQREEFVLSIIEQNHSSRNRRDVDSYLSIARSSLVVGDVDVAQRYVDKINDMLGPERRHKKLKRAWDVAWAPAALHLEGDELVWEVNDPVWNEFEAWQQDNPNEIFANRRLLQEMIPELAVQSNLKWGGEDSYLTQEQREIEYLRLQLDNWAVDEKRQIKTEAQKLGIDPNYRFAEIDRQREVSNKEITTSLGLERAHTKANFEIAATGQLINTSQKALVTTGPTAPDDPSYALWDAINAQAIAETEASYARDASIANMIGGITDAGITAYGAYAANNTTGAAPGGTGGSGSSRLSSGGVQSGLGVKDDYLENLIYSDPYWSGRG